MANKDSSQDEAAKTAQLEKRLKALEADLRQKKEIILAQHTKLEAFFDSSIDAVVQMDFDGHITGWNHQAEKTFGWSAEEILDRKIEDTIVPERYREAHRNGMQRYISTGEASIMNSLIEIHALHRDGHEFPVELSISVIDTPDLQEFNAYIRDITKRKQAESLIWNQANFDSLTNLPNRNLFLQKLEHEIHACDRNNRSLALLYLDLDHFKHVNDTLGHDMGDLLLTETAQRLTASVREVDTVSRMGGDEFTVLLGNIDDPLSVQRVCQQILETLADPFLLENETVHVTSSIGVTFYPGDSQDIEILQRNADQAMYAAKGLGRNRYHFFTPELQQRARRKREMVDDLRSAMQESRLEIHYQPIVAMKDRRINKAEALLRWPHPDSGMISPSVFIPLAEESGMISELGNWVFEKTLAQVGRWREAFNPDFQVSFNTTPLQWIDAHDAMSGWFGLLSDSGVSGQAIIVEITEALLMNTDDRITNRLLDFREAGMQFSIDDFGTGYSSIAYLKQFDIDYLKIDHSFIRNLGRGQNDRALCEATILMAHRLGIEVIAEGVESEEQDRLLREIECDFAQGFLYSKSLPAADFEALLART